MASKNILNADFLVMRGVFRLQSNISRSNLENLCSVQYWPKRALFFLEGEKKKKKKKKKGTKNLTTPNSIPFLSVLHRNRALHNFHKRRQRPIAGRIKGVDYALHLKWSFLYKVLFPKCCVLSIEL